MTVNSKEENSLKTFVLISSKNSASVVAESYYTYKNGAVWLSAERLWKRELGVCVGVRANMLRGFRGSAPPPGIS